MTVSLKHSECLKVGLIILILYSQSAFVMTKESFVSYALGKLFTHYMALSQGPARLIELGFYFAPIIYDYGIPNFHKNFIPYLFPTPEREQYNKLVKNLILADNNGNSSRFVIAGQGIGDCTIDVNDAINKLETKVKNSPGKLTFKTRQKKTLRDGICGISGKNEFIIVEISSGSFYVTPFSLMRKECHPKNCKSFSNNYDVRFNGCKLSTILAEGELTVGECISEEQRI